MSEYQWKNPYYRVWDLYANKTLVGNLVVVKGYYMGRIYPNTKWTLVYVSLLREAKAAMIATYEAQEVKP